MELNVPFQKEISKNYKKRQEELEDAFCRREIRAIRKAGRVRRAKANVELAIFATLGFTSLIAGSIWILGWF